MAQANQRPRQTGNEYVDIHGNNLSTTSIPNAEPTINLIGLKQTGFGIYQKTQYAKLAAINDQDFDDDFHSFMLDAAKNYMLENKHIFLEEDILSTITNCKTKLIKDIQQPAHKREKPFFKGRQVEEVTDNDIVIQVNNTSPSSSVSSNGRRSNFFTGKPSLSPRELSFVSEPEKTQSRSTKQKEKNKLHNSKQPSHPNDKARSNLKFQFNTSGAEYNCIVTCIDKRNCVWVRDKANNGLFIKVFNMANDEAEGQETALKPWSMDKVYIARDEDSWFRCKIIKYIPLTVFFLDYGNVTEVDEIREVSEELAKIPSLAVRITFRESDYNPVLEDEIRMKIFMQNEDGTFFVKILPKSSTTTGCFQKPDYLAQLEDGLRVTIIHEDSSVIYLRSFECFAKLKQIEADIRDYIKVCSEVQVTVNQLILCRDEETNEFRRGIVTKITGRKVEVEFLDYIKTRTVDMNTLRTINEKLSLEPITYIPGKNFIGFKGGRIDNIAKHIIKESIDTRKKYTVVLDFDDNLDLFDGTKLLSELLQNHGKITLQDVKPFKPEFGSNAYVCGCFKSSSDLSLVNTDALQQYQNDVFQSDVGSESYMPVVNEVCLCLYEGDWYRCVVTRILNQEYEVLFLDFGNIELIKKENIRKPENKVVEVPALALPCRLINLPKLPKIEEQLKKFVCTSNIYTADIKSITDGKCDVELPLIYQKIKDS